MQSFQLQKADPDEFLTYCSVYFDPRMFFFYNWRNCLTGFKGELGDLQDVCWITCQGRRAGGVSLGKAGLFGYFPIPPFEDSYEMVSALVDYLQSQAQGSPKLTVHGVFPHQQPYYQQHGFQIKQTRLKMIRPNEAFPDLACPPGFTASKPDQNNPDQVSQVIYAANLNTIGQEEFSEIKSSTDRCIAQWMDPQASTLLFDDQTGQAVAACLVTDGEQHWLPDKPLFSGIYDIGVLPQYQGKGLAGYMLKHALNASTGKSPIMELFVTRGNPAEAIYRHYGFLAGVPFSTMERAI
jgi:ribosomal protein S18 acetylase RimI-like enzyme